MGTIWMLPLHTPLLLLPLSLLLLLLYSSQTSSLCQQPGRLLSVCRSSEAAACRRDWRVCVRRRKGERERGRGQLLWSWREQTKASPAVSSLLLDLGIFFSAVSDLLFLSRLL